MARCRECNFFELDEDGRCSCNHPLYQPSLFGFDIPEEIDCDGFERCYSQDEHLLDSILGIDIDQYLESRGYR